jgi:hypothetical protein
MDVTNCRPSIAVLRQIHPLVSWIATVFGVLLLVLAAVRHLANVRASHRWLAAERKSSTLPVGGIRPAVSS